MDASTFLLYCSYWFILSVRTFLTIPIRFEMKVVPLITYRYLALILNTVTPDLT
ncbi:hypothetical protein QWZ13_03900 [Reinekea marina]|uniref:hypothetical protein n=1 Tax=Reinekea marina TaxID=1310421 RepID=UPI0025B2BE57|nr:hypothetical protein [Reinekea marina]MDN3648045.1 hypothetical protein [Reinekea marina]